jgi:hypothetical protein
MQLTTYGSNNQAIQLREFYPEYQRNSADDYSYYLMRLSTIWGEDFLEEELQSPE